MTIIISKRRSAHLRVGIVWRIISTRTEISWIAERFPFLSVLQNILVLRQKWLSWLVDEFDVWPNPCKGLWMLKFDRTMRRWLCEHDRKLKKKKSKLLSKGYFMKYLSEQLLLLYVMCLLHYFTKHKNINDKYRSIVTLLITIFDLKEGRRPLQVTCRLKTDEPPFSYSSSSSSTSFHSHCHRVE